MSSSASSNGDNEKNLRFGGVQQGPNSTSRSSPTGSNNASPSDTDNYAQTLQPPQDTNNSYSPYFDEMADGQRHRHHSSRWSHHPIDDAGEHDLLIPKRRDQDSMYKLIDAPQRGGKLLFGMAKSFPQITRTGWRDMIEDKMEESGGIDETGKAVEKVINDVSEYSVLFRLKKRYHAEFAEFFAMFVFMLLGHGASCQLVIGGDKYSSPSAAVLAWGFANMIGIYIAGGYSGAHLNPVLTLALWFFRGFPLKRVMQFWLAQLLGAFAGSAWAFLLYYPALKEFNGPGGWDPNNGIGSAFYTIKAANVPVSIAWFNEVTATMVMFIAIFAVGDSHNVSPVSGMNALVLGLTVYTIGLCLGYNTTWAMNPTRDITGRFILSMVGFPNEIWTSDKLYWLVVPITGPLVGGFLGSFAYDLFVFDGPESPLNFPMEIKERALKAWLRSTFRRPHPHRKSAALPIPVDSIHGKIQVPGQPGR